jgi:AcrR family transcriptional regulator
MARPPGARNASFAQRRQELAQAAARALLRPDGGAASFRSLVAATGASASVLQHYFGAHEGLVLAAFEAAREMGEFAVQAMATPGDAPLRESMQAAAAWLCEGWRVGVGTVHAAGLVHGLGNPTLGPAYVEHLLEPAITSVEARLAVHRDRGELRAEVDLRYAALAFVSPLLLALLHQGELSGRTCRPLDLEGFLDAHVKSFVAGWGAVPPGERAAAS